MYMYIAHRAKSITNGIPVLIGTCLYLGEEKQLWIKVLLKCHELDSNPRPNDLSRTLSEYSTNVWGEEITRIAFNIKVSIIRGTFFFFFFFSEY